MRSEYVKLTRPEVVYSQKNLLSSQIEIINLLKSYEQYKKIRKEEFVLKVALKSKLEEAKESLNLLSSLLPKIKVYSANIPEETTEGKRLSRKKLSFEQEIQEIRNKLRKLI